MASLKVISSNVKGLRADFKRKKMFNFFNNLNYDYCCLQETHSDILIEKDWESEWGGKVLFNHGTSNRLGVAIFHKGKHKILEEITDNSGRYAAIKILLDNKKILIASVYAPNTEKEQKEFFTAVHLLINNTEYDELILGGDFNICLNNVLDKKGGNFNVKSSLPVLKNIIASLNLTDTWRKNNPGVKQFTWKQTQPEVMCRLDYLLLSKGLDAHSKEQKIVHVPNTDHKGVTVAIELQNRRRGRSFWKHNNSLLQNKQYTEQMETLIDSIWHNTNDVTDVRAKYDYMKFKIQQFSVQFSKQLAKQRKETEDNCQRKINELDIKQMESTLSNSERSEQTRLKNKIEEIYDYKVRGEIIRSKVEQIESGEKSTAFFFRKVKHNYEKKTIEELTVNGNKTNDADQINSEIKQYYTKLYSSTLTNAVDPTDILRDSKLDGLPQLNDMEKYSLQSLITLEEMHLALKDMKENKSPGSDGLSAEFYKTFWNKLGPKLEEVIKFSATKKELPLSFRQGVITLLQKPNKDPLLIKNYRPITLLNCDYKIYSKALANRMSKNIKKLIDNDQTGFIQGRYIGENIRTIEDIINYANENNKQGLLLQLDFEKAYDSIEWPFLFSVLKKFNFPDNLIEGIKLLYTNIISTVVNDGYSCGWFKLERGVRQGCPLSCILFILCVEILAEIIRKTPEVKGFTMNNKEKKISQFADDTSCILTDCESVNMVIDLAKTFQKFSGLKLNKEKSEIMWFGAWKLRTDSINDMSAPNQSINLLGTQIGHDHKKCYEINFKDKVNKINNNLTQWKQRNLSLIGRILIAKSQGISNLVYTMSTQYTDPKWLSEPHRCLRNFIWNDRPSKVKHNTLAASYTQGGLKAPDIFLFNKAIKLAWVGRILSKDNWNVVLESQLHKYGGLLLLLNCNFAPQKIQVAPFYRQMLDFFQKLFHAKHKEQIIWNNKQVKFNKETIFWEAWYEKGLISYSQVMDNELNFISRRQLNISFTLDCDENTYKKFKTSVKRGARQFKRTHNTPFTDVTRAMIERPIFKSKADNLIDVRKATCKTYYNELIETVCKEPAAFEKWRIEYHIPNNILYSSYVSHQKSCVDTRLLVFQYKILNDIIANNKNLSKWGIKDTPKCNFCEETDTVKHMFWECERSKTTFRTIFHIFRIPQTMYNEQQIIFGTADPATNVMLLVAKKMIWQSRFYETNFKIEDYIRSVQLQIQADLNKLRDGAFNQKWQEFIFIMEL